MPDLSESLRAYFDELVSRSEQSLAVSPARLRRRRAPRRALVGAALAVVVGVVSAVVVARTLDDEPQGLATTQDVDGAANPAPLFGEVEELVPTPLPQGWARCSGAPAQLPGADEQWWSQSFGPVSEGSCRPLITVTQLPPDAPASTPFTAEDDKVGDADVSRWSDPDRGSQSMFTWAFDQNLLVEACCDDAAWRYLEHLVGSSLNRTRDTAPAHCTRPESDLDSEDLITNLTGKNQRVVDNDGCPIRTDIATMFTVPAEAHCFAGLSFATVGTPFGSSIEKTGGRTYVRDPAGELGEELLDARLDLDARLPATAVDTGYSRDGRTLWVDEADDAVIYVIDRDSGEAWPRLNEQLSCA